MSPPAHPDALRNLPAVGVLLDRAAAEAPDRVTGAGRERLARALREVLAELRDRVRGGEAVDGAAAPQAVLAEAIARVEAEGRPRLRRVVNATGVVLHTNLGRAPLPAEAIARVAETAGYANLEVDLATGRRGRRHEPVEELLVRLTGAEAAVVVNNGAAAVLLAVGALAAGREVVVSRGQLVEIGGGFRLPEVIASAGARLVEVGTTNRTYPSDYARAIGPDTALLLRSHTSNFKVTGFTAEVEPAELAALGREAGIPTLEDLGSGVLVDLTAFGLPAEPTVQASVAANLDLVVFSGDKLLGGPQAGILVGRREVVERLARHPLVRALRCDKLVLAALEATLALYLDADRAPDRIPTLRLLGRSPRELAEAARDLARALADTPGLVVETVPGTSPAGGGSLPGVELETTLVTLRPQDGRAHLLADRLRTGAMPVVARVSDDAVLLDPRTLLEGDAARVVQAVHDAVAARTCAERKRG